MTVFAYRASSSIAAVGFVASVACHLLGWLCIEPAGGKSVFVLHVGDSGSLDSPGDDGQPDETQAPTRQRGSFDGRAAKMGTKRCDRSFRLCPSKFCLFHLLRPTVSKEQGSILPGAARVFRTLDVVLQRRVGRFRWSRAFGAKENGDGQMTNDEQRLQYSEGPKEGGA